MSQDGAARSAWLVTGNDSALVSQEVSALVKRLLDGADRASALEDFSGRDDDTEGAVVGAVCDACATPPFLSDRRVVVFRDAGYYKADQLQLLLNYLASPLPSTRLVIVGGGDGGALPAKVAAALKQSPLVEVVGTEVSGKEAHGWLTGRLAGASVILDSAASSMVEKHLGDNLGRLSALVATLEAAYAPGTRLGPADVEPYLGEAGGIPPWDLTDAIDRGDTAAALALLHRFIEGGSRHPLVALAVLARHFGNILRVQSPSVTTEAQAAEALGIPKGRSTYPARKALDAARRMGAANVGEAVAQLADAELALKGKLDWDGVLVLEVLVARLCRLAKSGSVASAPTSSRRR